MNACGSCTMCCKVMAITELEKPRDQWCKHVDKGVGCTIYETRPESCRGFECVWLQSQAKPGYEWDASLRPDRCHVVVDIANDQKTLVAHVDPGYPNAAAEGSAAKMLARAQAGGLGVVIAVGRRRDAFLPGSQPIRFYENTDAAVITTLVKRADGTVGVVPR